jgi:RNA polymerase sigma-70 factor, ECF subfamily
MDIIQLWEQYSGELIGYLQKATHGTGDAEDIASEVFLRVVKNKALLERMSSKQCRLWIYTTAKHIVIDIARKRKLESRIIPPPDLTQDDLSVATVSQVIGMLPVDLQDLVAMRYFADMDSTAIGNALEIPPATVRTRLRKACALLRKYWNEN